MKTSRNNLKINKRFMFALFTISVTTLGMLACDEKSAQPSYIPGKVSVIAKGEKTIEELFGLINKIEPQVDYMFGVGLYTVTLPKDSLSYLLRVINKKSYTKGKINSFTANYEVTTNQIVVDPILYLMNSQDYQLDWLETTRLLNLKPVLGPNIPGYRIIFNVPIGSENEWVKKFESYEEVYWSGRLEKPW